MYFWHIFFHWANFSHLFKLQTRNVGDINEGSCLRKRQALAKALLMGSQRNTERLLRILIIVVIWWINACFEICAHLCTIGLMRSLYRKWVAEFSEMVLKYFLFHCVSIQTRSMSTLSMHLYRSAIIWTRNVSKEGYKIPSYRSSVWSSFCLDSKCYNLTGESIVNTKTILEDSLTLFSKANPVQYCDRTSWLSKAHKFMFPVALRQKKFSSLWRNHSMFIHCSK